MEGKNIVLTKNSRSAEDKTDTLQEMATVRGKVTDSRGEPIIGANILEKGPPMVLSPIPKENLA